MKFRTKDGIASILLCCGNCSIKRWVGKLRYEIRCNMLKSVYDF